MKALLLEGMAVCLSQVYDQDKDTFKYYQFYRADTQEEFEYFHMRLPCAGREAGDSGKEAAMNHSFLQFGLLCNNILGRKHDLDHNAPGGLRIDRVLVDGVDSYSFRDVWGNHTISVSFVKTVEGDGGEGRPETPDGGDGKPETPDGGNGKPETPDERNGLNKNTCSITGFTARRILPGSCCFLSREQDESDILASCYVQEGFAYEITKRQ